MALEGAAPGRVNKPIIAAPKRCSFWFCFFYRFWLRFRHRPGWCRARQNEFHMDLSRTRNISHQHGFARSKHLSHLFKCLG